MIGSLFTAQEVGKGIGGLFKQFAEQKTEDVMNYVVWKTAVALGVQHCISEGFSLFEDASTDRITGISPNGIMQIIIGMIDVAMKMAIASSKDLSEELFGEMIQEGISNAVQTSLGGALQTIWNVYRGSFPALQDYSRDVGNAIDQVDDKIASLICVLAGTIVPTIVFDLVRGANQNLEDTYKHAVGQVELAQNFVNNQAFSVLAMPLNAVNQYALRLVFMRWEAVRTYNETIRRVAEEHLARLNELEDTLESIKMWYDNKFLSEEEAITYASKIEAEFNATWASFNEYLNTAQAVLEETFNTINANFEQIRNSLHSAYNDLFDVMYKLHDLLIRSVDDDTIKSELIAKLNQVYHGVRCYREIPFKDIQFE